MSNKVRVRKLERGFCMYIHRESFSVGYTRLIVEDRIPVFSPWRGERILRIAGTTAFYSAVPLCSAGNRLLCYNYCEDALNKQAQKPGYYRHALVLGCGGGAIPGWLLGKYPDIKVDVVDRSPEIIAVSKKYFLHKWEKSGRLMYTCVDAHDFKPPNYSYQFIFCDLFDGENLAPLVYDRSFAEKLRSMISDDGLLVINCGFDHQNDVWTEYQGVFEHLRIVERKPWQTEVIKASGSPFKAWPK